MAVQFMHIVGARPNFPKLAPVHAALQARDASQYIVHTGQHYDPQLSSVFFEQLGLPREDVNLGIGGGSHAVQTASVMQAIEPIFERVAPEMVVVYGDVNSTVAAALVASKMSIPVAHVEAGLRSRDRSMPEELNRLVTDALCDVALATSDDAVENLLEEGRDADTIALVGNPMIDSLRAVEPTLAPSRSAEMLGKGRYGVVTMHRPGNVDHKEVFATVVDALIACADTLPLVFPVHPRGRAAFEASALGAHKNVKLIEPLAYQEFLSTMRDAAVVLTDSGGVQEETTAFGVPCLTLRPNTERPVTVTHGTNRLVTPGTLASGLEAALAPGEVAGTMPHLWDGKAGPRIAEALLARV